MAWAATWTRRSSAAGSPGQLATTIEEAGVDKVAAFIAEPVQGAGGAIIPPETYWPEIQKICDHYGILLIADEVICGIGRLGHWFGSQHYGIRPDLMPFAKGITSGYQALGGVMVSDRVADVLVEKGGEFYHGFTYSAHPVACAVARATLKVMRDEKLVERVRDAVIPAFSSRWQKLAEPSRWWARRGPPGSSAGSSWCPARTAGTASPRN